MKNDNLDCPRLYRIRKDPGVLSWDWDGTKWVKSDPNKPWVLLRYNLNNEFYFRIARFATHGECIKSLDNAYNYQKRLDEPWGKEWNR